MRKMAIFCIANTEFQAQNIVEQLKVVGFASDDISALFPDRQGSHDFAYEHNTKAPEGAATGAATGGLIGGTLGWLAGIGTLALPGIGPFIAAGPLLAALGGVAAGAAVGGLTGALIGLGLPEFEAKRFEGKIRHGNILISVHAEDAAHLERARKVFEAADAHDITSAAEAGVPRYVAGNEDRRRW